MEDLGNCRNYRGSDCSYLGTSKCQGTCDYALSKLTHLHEPRTVILGSDPDKLTEDFIQRVIKIYRSSSLESVVQ